MDAEEKKKVFDTNYEDMKEWLRELDARLTEWSLTCISTLSKDGVEKLQEDIAMTAFTTGLIVGKVKEREGWGMDGEPMAPLEDKE